MKRKKSAVLTVVYLSGDGMVGGNSGRKVRHAKEQKHFMFMLFSLEEKKMVWRPGGRLGEKIHIFYLRIFSSLSLFDFCFAAHVLCLTCALM